MDKFWDAVQTIAEAAVLLLFAGAIFAVGMLMNGMH